MTRIKTLLIAGLSLFSLANAEATQSPLKFRFNREVLQNIIRLRDQGIFDAFKDKEIASSEDNPMEHLEEIKFSIEPIDGVEVDDFNLDVHISSEYFGAETDKVQTTGTAVLKDGSEIAFKAPFPLLKLKYVLGKKFNSDFNFEANSFQESDWIYQLGEVSGDGLSDDAKVEIGLAISNYLDKFKKDFEGAQSQGQEEVAKIVGDFPMDTVIPMVLLNYAVSFSEYFEEQDKYIGVGYNLEHFNFLTEKQAKMLKDIQGDFYNEQNHQGDHSLIQFTVDDNLFNSFASLLTSVDKSFSMRDMMKGNPKLKPVLSAMKTDAVGSLIPTFPDEYGADKNLDVMYSPSHALFLAGFPNAKMSGVYIDKNGNWKFVINIMFNLNVEVQPGNWESAREVYCSLIFKQKISVDATNPFSKKLSWTPKNVEVTNFKILKDGKEEEMEQMMVQSVINIQLENLKREFKEYPFHMKDILSNNPKELNCLGFMISDLDFGFKKSQMQTSVYYKPSKYQNKEMCDKFMKDLKEAPQKIMEEMNKAKGDSNFMKAFEEAQKLGAGDASANPFDALGKMNLPNMGGFGGDQKKDSAKRMSEDVSHEDL